MMRSSPKRTCEYVVAMKGKDALRVEAAQCVQQDGFFYFTDTAGADVLIIPAAGVSSVSAEARGRIW